MWFGPAIGAASGGPCQYTESREHKRKAVLSFCLLALDRTLQCLVQRRFGRVVFFWRNLSL